MQQSPDSREIVHYISGFPFNIFIHSLDRCHFHTHEEIELLLVLEGSIRVLLFGETYTLGRGEIIVISAETLHATEQTGDPNLVLALQLNPASSELFKHSLDGLVFKPNGIETSAAIQIRTLLCNLYLDIMYKQDGYRMLALSRVLEICSYLLRSVPHKQTNMIKCMRQKDQERITRILSYISEHSSEKLTLQQIAKEEYLSTTYLSTLLHKGIGMKFSDYLNSIRLKTLTEMIQTHDSMPLEDIAMQCGFSSVQYANILMKRAFNLTLGEYRKRLSQPSHAQPQTQANPNSNPYSTVYHFINLDHIKQFLSAGNDAPPVTADEANLTQRSVTLSAATGAVAAYHGSAVQVASIGRAYEVLLKTNQRQIEAAKSLLHFTGLHFHGIFNDEMMVVQTDQSGRYSFSFTTIDIVLDYLLSIRLTPYLELTFMPSLFASGETTVFSYRANITPPVDISAWCALVNAFIRHCADRYGVAEVSSWVFEIWNEPDLYNYSWVGSEFDFHQLYIQTVRTLRAVLPSIRIAGPSITLHGLSGNRWLSNFEEISLRENVLADILTLHAYPEIPKAIAPSKSRRSIIDHDEEMLSDNYVTEILDMARQQRTAMRAKPLLVTEWNITMYPFNPINDSSFAATSLIRSALLADAPDVTLIHWTLLDNMSEQPLPMHEFHGGFGLITVHGLYKPTFFAMYALSKLYAEILYQDSNLCVTREGAAYRILAYHHPKTKAAYSLAYAHDESFDSSAPVEKDLSIQLVLEGLNGHYKAARHSFKPSSSVRAAMKNAGIACPLYQEDIAYLHKVPGSDYSVTYHTISQEFSQIKFQFYLPPSSFELLDLKPLS